MNAVDPSLQAARSADLPEARAGSLNLKPEGVVQIHKLIVPPAGVVGEHEPMDRFLVQKPASFPPLGGAGSVVNPGSAGCSCLVVATGAVQDISGQRATTVTLAVS